jgi:hypothetical protein
VLKHKGQVFTIKAVVSILGWTWFGDGLPGVNGTLSQARTGSGLSDQRYAHKVWQEQDGWAPGKCTLNEDSLSWVPATRTV